MSSGRITRFQNNIRVDGDLDLSNSTGYLTLSSLSSAPSSPTVGDSYYDSTLGKARMYQTTGWTNVDGTAAGTLNAAKSLAIDDKLGTLEKSKFADILILNNDPTKQIQYLNDSIETIMLAGNFIDPKSNT